MQGSPTLKKIHIFCCWLED